MHDKETPATADNIGRDILFIFFKHLRLILLTGIAVLAAAIAVVLYWPPTYGAFGSVLLKGKELDRDINALEQAELRTYPLTESDVYSELKIITSDELFGETLKSLERRGSTEALMALDEDPAMRIINLRRAIEAKVVPTSNVIEVTISGKQPATTLEILQTLFATYSRYRNEVYSKGQALNDFMDRQVEWVQARLEEKNGEIGEFVGRTGLTNADGQIAANVSMMSNLETTLVGLEGEAADLREQIRHLQGLLDAPNVQVFSTVYLDDGVQLTGRSEITAHLRQQNGRLQVIEDRMAAVEQRIDDLQARNLTLRRDDLTFQAMDSEAQVLARAYQTLLTRQAEALIDAKAAEQELDPYISFLVPPRLMKDPISPRPEIVLPAGLLAALLLALGLALTREYLDQSFTRGEEIPRILDVPLLFSIPKGAAISRSVRTSRKGSRSDPRPAQERPKTAPAAPTAGALAAARGGGFSSRSKMLTAFATVIVVGLVLWAATGSAGAPEFSLNDLNPLNSTSSR